ncbi:MAG: CDP-diacylglycerol O-phosphatidyltransferase [Candidatus Binatia bacterium]|nr:CDP-diacylglycerol O-phosphatidyltransferase [Candidatus Binatia bacterium]
MSALLAWLVHLYTASGILFAVFALLLIEQGFYQSVFWLMSLAVVVDATDGTMARKVRIKEVIPWFDGDRLEDIVDYLNYVLVPCALIVRAGLLPQNALWLAGLPLLASAYGFCQCEAKTADHYFLGFPSYWNIVTFYFYVLGTPGWLNVSLLSVFAVLVFVPIRYVYPSRTPILRGLTVTLGILWGFMILATIYLLPDPPTLLAHGSLLFPIYYAALSFWLEIRSWKAGV